MVSTPLINGATAQLMWYNFTKQAANQIDFGDMLGSANEMPTTSVKLTEATVAENIAPNTRPTGRGVIA